MPYRWILLGLVGLLLPCSSPADELPIPLKTRIAGIAREYQARWEKYQEELKIAGTDRTRSIPALNEYNRDRNRLEMALKTIVKENSEDPVAFDALYVLVVQIGSQLDNLSTHVAAQHLADPRAGVFCLSITTRQGEPWAEVLIMQAAQTHPIKDVRGQAVFALGEYYRLSAQRSRRKLGENEMTRLLSRARDWYSEASKNYASSPSPDGTSTIGVMADQELTRLANLPNLKVGRPAPEIAGQGVDGRSFKLSDHRGKVVVVVFWNSGCRPCLEMVPDEIRMHERLKGRPFVLLGVNGDENRELAQATMSRLGIDWRSWWDGTDQITKISTSYNILGVPATFVIDQFGIIRYLDVRGRALDDAVDSLLSEQANQVRPPGR
jgi:peroxiredoxin